ncbi:MAG: hypothetical protein WAW22_13235 [Smithellaceae bacterium]
MSRSSHHIGKVLGIIGISCVGFFLLVNFLTSGNVPLGFWISILLLFIGGEIIIAVGSILTAKAKGRGGLGVVAALFGLFGLGWIFFLRPGLYPSILLSLFGPVGFLIILFLITKDKGEDAQS